MTIDLQKAAKKANERPTIYPKLGFGQQGNEEGSVIIRFGQPTFQQALNPKPLPGQSGEFLTILVDVTEPSDFGQLPGVYQLNCSPGSTLGDAVLQLWSQHNQNLMGVRARVETRNYMNKKFNKMTRAYSVTEIKGT